MTDPLRPELAERLRHAVDVANVDFEQRNPGRQILGGAARQIVECGTLMAVGHECVDDMAADKPRSAGNENTHDGLTAEG